MCWWVFVWVLLCEGVRLCGFCNVWVCVWEGVGFVKCRRVYVWVL